MSSSDTPVILSSACIQVCKYLLVYSSIYPTSGLQPGRLYYSRRPILCSCSAGTEYAIGRLCVVANRLHPDVCMILTLMNTSSTVLYCIVDALPASMHEPYEYL